MTGILFLMIRLILALILLAFLGVALLTLWRDLRAQDKILTHRNIPLLSLVPIAGAFSPPRQFTNPEVLIGRDPACDFVLEDATISARHARLSYRLAQWWIEDLHSTNGTFLNQENITGATVLTDGDEVRCGQIQFSIKISVTKGSFLEHSS